MNAPNARYYWFARWAEVPVLDKTSWRTWSKLGTSTLSTFPPDPPLAYSMASKALTVEQVIEQLQKLPKDFVVEIYNPVLNETVVITGFETDEKFKAVSPTFDEKL